MSETELAVGESMVTKEAGGLRVETTRSEQTLFTTTYTDMETGDVRLALRVDVTTGQTAIDPRHIDSSFWTLVADDQEYPMSELPQVLGQFDAPSIEVKPEDHAIRVYAAGD